MAVAGVAARKKTGETVSGDAGTYFKRHDGKLYLLLCDGMGSGPEANRESTLAVRLLEQLLQAGDVPLLGHYPNAAVRDLFLKALAARQCPSHP